MEAVWVCIKGYMDKGNILFNITQKDNYSMTFYEISKNVGLIEAVAKW